MVHRTALIPNSRYYPGLRKTIKLKTPEHKNPDKMWSTGKGNGKPLQYSYLESPINSMKRQKDRTLKDELPRSVGAQYATGDQWRNTPERMKRWSQNETNKQTKTPSCGCDW